MEKEAWLTDGKVHIGPIKVPMGTRIVSFGGGLYYLNVPSQCEVWYFRRATPYEAKL